MAVTLRPLDLPDAPAVHSLRLAGRDDVAVVAVRAGDDIIVTRHPISGDEPTVVGQVPAGLGVPAWDVPAGGPVSVVWAEPSSAASTLWCRRPGVEDEVEVSARHPMGLFFAPRFVRGGPAPAGVVAVRARQGTRSAVVFDDPGAGAYEPCRSLWTCPAGVLRHAVVVTTSQGLLLFAGVASGASLAVHAVDVAAAAASAGTMVTAVPGGAEAFDVDVAGDTIWIFAVRAGAAMLLRGEQVEEAWRFEPVFHLPTGATLASPSILVADGVLRVAALASAGTPDAAVLLGAITIEAAAAAIIGGTIPAP